MSTSTPQPTRTVDIITMGCSKNLVDSEQLLNLFNEHGFQVYHNPDTTHGDIAVINTCGFIASAKEESINEILELCELKTDGELNRVYVMGCLSERYITELREEIPEVDKFYGKFNWKELITDLCAEQSSTPPVHHEKSSPRRSTMLTSKSPKDATATVPTVPFLSSRESTRADLWKKYSTRCAH